MEYTFYIVVVETDRTSRLCNLKSESKGTVWSGPPAYWFLHVCCILGQYQKNTKIDDRVPTCLGYTWPVPKKFKK